MPQLKIKLKKLKKSIKKIKITKIQALVLFTIVADILILIFLFAWQILGVTSPNGVKEFFRTLDFTVYFILILILIFLFIAINILFLITKFKPLFFFTRKTIIITNLIFISAIVGLILGTYVFKHPVLADNYPEYDQNLIDYSRPLEIEFNVPVRTSKLRPSITPEMEGEWKWENYMGIPGMTRKGKFYPTQSAYPEERFVVYVIGISKLAESTEHEYGYVFRAPKLPAIRLSEPAQNSTDVARDQSVKLSIDKDSSDLVDWVFKFSPETEFDTEFNELNQIVLTPVDLLEQGIQYTVDISYKPKIIDLTTKETIESEKPTEIDSLSFTTAKAPLVKAFTPNGIGILVDTEIKAVFEQDMDRESVEENLSITPAIEGEIIWDNDTTLRFVPTNDLSKETKYSFKLAEGARNLSGGVLESDIVFDFTTIGRVNVLATSPVNGAADAHETSTITVTFDQQVDKASAQSKFSTSPSIAGAFSWDQNTMIFTPANNLEFERSYSYSIAPGVASVSGIDSSQSFNFSFRTRSNQVQFTIPIFYQPPGFACNIFTARMILAWKGFESDHVSLIAEIGYDDNRSGDAWTGNPYTEYVGNADGSWGYGTYYPTLQRIFSARGIQSEAHVSWDISSMARAVQGGRPVIIWRYNGVGGGQDISWRADDGTFVNAFNGMHGSVITGYIGSVDNPTHFYINDPWLGQYWISASELDGYWSYSGRMALEVF